MTDYAYEKNIHSDDLVMKDCLEKKEPSLLRMVLIAAERICRQQHPIISSW